MGKLKFENYIYDGEVTKSFDELTEEEKNEYRKKMLTILKSNANVETCEVAGEKID